MIARLASSAPPPAWEVWTTLLISVVTAMLVVWFAAKVFKVALLMHGRPAELRDSDQVGTDGLISPSPVAAPCAVQRSAAASHSAMEPS